jgi:hypothetical protein
MIMGDQFVFSEQRQAEHEIDVSFLASRLDRMDILLLREFYLTGKAFPDDTISHVLRLLADKVRRGQGPLARLSYGAIRHRLENLVALGLLGRIPRTNPAVYYPLDWMVQPVRKTIALFAADFVGILRNRGGHE